MSRYANAVKVDIQRWIGRGLIDQATGDRLADDIDANAAGGLSFGNVLAIMAALLVGAAILLFIAANWEAIPRIGRVAALFAVLFASFTGGALLKAQGREGFGEALYLLGCVTFGGAIALVGQMYHLVGDERLAVLVWCILGALIPAAALRSHVLTNAAVVLAVVWLVLGLDFNVNPGGPDWRYLGLGGMIWIVSLWTGSTVARHLLLLSLVLFGFLAGLEGDWFSNDNRMVVAGTAMAIISAIIFIAAWLAPDQVERFAKLGGPYPVHPMIGFLVGIGMIQSQIAEDFGPMLVTSLVAFAAIVAALLMRGRQSRLMRWLCYIAFIIELFTVYVITLGTMIDTSILFLLSGVALAAVAWFITRVEKRMAQPGASA